MNIELSQEQSVWRKFGNFKVGIIPVKVYVPLCIITYLVMAAGKLPKDMLGAIPVMMLMGFTFAEIGKRIPILKNIGGAAMVTIFLPSYLVAHNLMPTPALNTITTFMKTTNFLYINIAMIVVGSILGMSRIVLIQGFIRMFFPLLIGTVVGAAAGVCIGMLLGYDAYHAFFFIVVPIMAGGIGEGAIPLSMGYAEILQSTPEQLFGQIVPAVMLGSLSGIILGGLLKTIGQKKPEYSGNGLLVKNDSIDISKELNEEKTINLAQMGAGALTAIGFYLLGVYVGAFIGIPGPIIMIFTAAVVKVCGLLPKEIEEGAYMIYRFFIVIVVFPLFIGVGAVLTSWKDIVAVLNPSYLITVFMTVFAMTASAFFVAKYLKMYPVEAAAVTACHSGQGSTGDIAILSAADRMVLMPFAQISTRIGGACMVIIATILMRYIQG
ncbi:2-hydroxycarboxylate transporter family protein [Sporomusa acidovorans]|uniref:Citrate/malate transporter n=1 Tax=Sporomusa acidovorans (strain ATCC 49682 / DSM 3132 / Mol) TaxID=1123286 RepID=A0ABZ3J2A9_SPOA4|nr:2-hydroxycarboxylate transporter family protein [Sporomusa acidovorans]OZC16549.1 citrate/malate transporter [Sporomusa acidovorans DSM 3132]SDF60967.1 malate:Na+ symporter [Sporomusa acidovorans]